MTFFNGLTQCLAHVSLANSRTNGNDQNAGKLTGALTTVLLAKLSFHYKQWEQPTRDFASEQTDRIFALVPRPIIFTLCQECGRRRPAAKTQSVPAAVQFPSGGVQCSLREVNCSKPVGYDASILSWILCWIVWWLLAARNVVPES